MTIPTIDPVAPSSVLYPGAVALIERQVVEDALSIGHDSDEVFSWHEASTARSAIYISTPRPEAARPMLSPTEALRVMRHELSALRARRLELRENTEIRRQVENERLDAALWRAS
ncbi:hypothetical protein GCM10010401_13970 [Rarobacter faecitabidus]|uniref:hypothetical protein n=1 Tax=Rarobacter faecitabidus TaxID=13243 RepID=UPI0011520A1B|nr:hypothetical protein [Rarobacter faecitabidus]